MFPRNKEARDTIQVLNIMLTHRDFLYLFQVSEMIFTWLALETSQSYLSSFPFGFKNDLLSLCQKIEWSSLDQSDLSKTKFLCYLWFDTGTHRSYDNVKLYIFPVLPMADELTFLWNIWVGLYSFRLWAAYSILQPFLKMLIWFWKVHYGIYLQCEVISKFVICSSPQAFLRNICVYVYMHW